ncbi:EF-hand domain-containing protein [uncultured Roseobacter sp.]|uniref:EF-hand domain-containing protein n=1 Tax=uncultured Roseobacter sp. TaxID=114847 RepID=UPI00262E50C3|nr:EF-hand domain-containing protein [uncultured Roseobacter sp.]
MKNVTLVAALMTSVAFSANAMSAEIDTDGDGKASLAELQVSYPELTEEVFGDIDTNGDGLVDDEEMAIAVELGNLADPEIDS